MSSLNVFIFLTGIFVFGLTALTDLRQRRIANELVLIVVGLAVVRMAFSGDFSAAMESTTWASVVLAISVTLWKLRFLGGGDAKLVFAAALLVGTSAMLDFLILTAILGGALGVLALIDLWIARRWGWSIGLAVPHNGLKIRDGAISMPAKATVPYGIAISFGCIATLLHTSFAAGVH